MCWRDSSRKGVWSGDDKYLESKVILELALYNSFFPFSDVLHQVGQNCPLKKSALLLKKKDDAPVFHPWVPGCNSCHKVQRRADVAVTALLQRLQDGKTHWYSFSDVPMIYSQEIAYFFRKVWSSSNKTFLHNLCLSGFYATLSNCDIIWSTLWYSNPWKQMVFAMGNPREIRKEVLAQLCEVYIHRPKVTVDVTKCLPYGWLIINSSNESPVFGSNDDFHLLCPTTTLTWTAFYIGWSSNACWHWSAYNKPDNRMFGLLLVWLLNRIKFIFDVSWNFHGQCGMRWSHANHPTISAFGCLSSLSLVQNSIF